MEASVCTADTSSADLSLSPGTCTVRSRALTIPDVTVPERPRGAPIATTGWPTLRDNDDPSEITFGSRDISTLSTARSVCGSRPVIVAGALWPSANSTTTDPPLAAIEMTWLFVKMWPSDRMTSPDPVPLPREPLAAIVTTEGTTLSATEITGHALTVDEGAELLEPDDWVALTIRPPTTPPTTSAVPSTTHSSHPLGLRAWPDSLTTAPKSRPGRSALGTGTSVQQVSHRHARSPRWLLPPIRDVKPSFRGQKGDGDQ